MKLKVNVKNKRKSEHKNRSKNDSKKQILTKQSKLQMKNTTYSVVEVLWLWESY